MQVSEKEDIDYIFRKIKTYEKKRDKEDKQKIYEKENKQDVPYDCKNDFFVFS